MFRKTITGSLMAVSLTAGALMTMPSAHAAPTWIGAGTVSGIGFLPSAADVAVADNGDAVATWVSGGRVLASSADHGTWGPAKFVSDAGKEVSSPSVAVNSQGDAAITWRQKDGLDHQRLAVSRRLADDTWNGWNLVSAPADMDVAGQADIALDAAGNLRAVYVATDNGSFNQVRLMKQESATTDVYYTSNMSDTDAFAPSLAMNANGAVLVSWMDVEGAESLIRSRRLAGPGAIWGPVENVSPLGSYGAETDTALSDSGFGSIAFVRNLDSDARVQAVKVQSDGFIGSPEFVSPVDEDAYTLNLDQNDAGTALLSWVAVGDSTEIGYATRSQNGGWVAKEINSPVANPTAPTSSIADNGTILVGYTGNEHLLASYRTKTFLPLSHVDSGDQNMIGHSTVAGMDDQGNAFLGGIRQSNPGEGEVRGAFLDTAGPAASTVALAANQKATTFNVGWNATDRLSEIATGTVRVRAAAWNGGFGAFSYPLLDSAAKSVAFNGAPGRTYCFSSQATDEVGNLSAWSGERCTTTPVDDRALKMAKGFKRANGGAHYKGTYTVATKKGATLTLKNVHASRIAILVTKSAKGGKIQVFFGKKNLGTYSLKGTGLKKLVAQKSLGGPKVGTLTIKVVSPSGKVVKIDGVIAAK